MEIKIWVEDVDTGKVLEDLGTCVTDSPSRAMEMYDQDEKWAELGYNADIKYKIIAN